MIFNQKKDRFLLFLNNYFYELNDWSKNFSISGFHGQTGKDSSIFKLIFVYF